MDTQILDQTIEILKPLAAAGGAIGTKVAASALWEWIKERFKSRSTAAVEAAADVEKAPENEVNWEVFRAQLAKAIAEDKGFNEELKKRVAEASPHVKQVSHTSGDNNKTIQITGSGNSVNT